MAVHQCEHSDDNAECSKSYFQPTNKREESGACSSYPERGGGRRSQRGRASIALRCCQLVLAVGTSMNNAG